MVVNIMSITTSRQVYKNTIWTASTLMTTSLYYNLLSYFYCTMSSIVFQYPLMVPTGHQGIAMLAVLDLGAQYLPCSEGC